MIADDLIIESDAGDDVTRAIFDDDGRVAYCYITENGEVKSDVWVYNRKKAPKNKPWVEDGELPYLNPEEYAFEMDELPISKADILIEWRKERAAKPIALIIVLGRLLASVSANEKPGYARLARVAGPLAKPLILR